MKFYRPLIVILIATAVAACASHQSAPPVAHTATVLLAKDAALWTQRIRSVLPPGWSVTTDGDSILVTRDQPVQWSPAGPNGPAFANAADAAAYAQAHASPGPYMIKFTFEPFMPLDEHARLRAANAAAQLTVHPLPTFYTTNYSVTLWVPDAYSQVLGPAADECNLVKSVLINLFTPYP